MNNELIAALIIFGTIQIGVWVLVGLALITVRREIAGYQQIQEEAALAYIRMTKENQQLNSRVNEMLVRTFGAEREPVGQ